ncbi:MAG: 50S ribosomal protein L4 [Flavobacteriales bacterium]|nr:50S ribosomal protein L4 [Flavobacteriales bacterium]
MKVNVLNNQGKETGRQVELKDGVFSIEPNDHAIYLDVKQYLANQRQGTHKSKDKSEIRASTRKIKRQKGTGTARAGSLKSGTRVGGGRIHGPRPRDYSFKLNKKVKRLARLSALAYKAKDNNIMVMEAFNFEKPNTKEFNNMIKALNLADQRSLFVVPEHNANINLSARNLPKSEVMTAGDLNTYQIMKAGKLVIVEGSINKIEEVLTA